MLIRCSKQIDAKPVMIEGAKDVSMRLLVGREHGAPNFAMRLFEVAPGGNTPHHHHNYEHEVLVLEGAGEVVGADQTKPLSAGDVVYMPANEMHQFKNTGEQTMKFICLVPTTHDCSGTPADTPGS